MNMSRLLMPVVALAMLAVLVVAILFEVLRRARERRQRLAAEWVTVEEIAREKGLSAEELNLLRGLIRRRSSRAPLRAVTVQQHFNQCAEKEIAVVAASNPGQLLEQGVLLRDIRVRLGLDYIPYGQPVQSTRQLYPGQTVWMADAVTSPTKWHAMTVAAIDEVEYHLAPAEPSPALVPGPGKKVLCRMLREDDGRYAFAATVERVQSDPLRLSFRHIGHFQRTQSRGYFRIRFEQSANLGIVDVPANGDTSQAASLPVVTTLRARFTSLSGSGYAAVVDQPPPRQALLRAKLLIDDREPLATTAEMVATSQVATGRYIVRARFINMSDEDRERITHFVFQQQQHLTKADAVETRRAD
jgi:c-di-GMP-binding flagellar brake protein YcgR